MFSIQVHRESGCEIYIFLNSGNIIVMGMKDVNTTPDWLPTHIIIHRAATNTYMSSSIHVHINCNTVLYLS